MEVRGGRASVGCGGPPAVKRPIEVIIVRLNKATVVVVQRADHMADRCNSAIATVSLQPTDS